MKKVFIVFNSDINEVMCVTEDKQLAEEYLMDCFINDVEYQWYWDQQYKLIKDLPILAQDIWNDLLDWYNNYVFIYEGDVI